MYYNINDPWVELLKSNFISIRNELDHFLSTNKQNLNSKYTDYTNNLGWQTIPLIFFTIKNPDTYPKFPITTAILNKIPELIGAEFSILNPETVIKAHVGYSKQIMRTHLGLKIPRGDLGLKCNQTTVKWKNGDIFSFNDGFLHEAWNNSNNERWVLMIDTPIPTSKYSAKDISRYKLETLDDPILLQIASKEKWLEWLKTSS